MVRRVRVGAQMIAYELVYTQRKTLGLRVLGKDTVRVYAPSGVRLQQADDFVRAQAEWIVKARAEIAKHEERHNRAHPVRDGATILYEGTPLPLRLERAEEPYVGRDEAGILVRAADEETARGALRMWLAHQAGERVADRMDALAPVVGKKPDGITIRAQKTRWGSCSSSGHMNFNYKLIMAPREALDYVVVHELCHLHDFNHSRKFWERVRAVMPDYEVWKKWLKDNGDRLGV